MPTKVEITCARIRDGRIESLGGMFNGRTWSMPADDILAEIEKPDGRRQWDFVVRAHGVIVPLGVVTQGRCLALEAKGVALRSLAKCPPEQLDGT
jgi:RES domain-containing protein